MQNKNNRNNRKKDIILYKDKTKKHLDYGCYKFIYKSKEYSIVFEKDTSIFYFITFMQKEKKRSMYHVNVESKICRSLGNDCYALGLDNKEIMYNASNNCFIGESHNKIYASKLYENCTIIINQDYLSNGKELHSITSYSNYDGKYLGSVYDKLTGKYYNPDNMNFDDIVSDINKKFVKKR